MSIKQTEQIIKSLLSETKDTKWREAVDYREANKGWLMKSAKIAIKINRELRNQNMSQKDLATKLGVSAQLVNKFLKGRENLSLKSISKLEAALGVELMNPISHREIDDMIRTAILEYHRKWTRTREYERKNGITGVPGAVLCVEEDNDYAKAG
jgi:ribosome-binding protein aMBF1 (putative translation factor)